MHEKKCRCPFVSASYRIIIYFFPWKRGSQKTPDQSSGQDGGVGRNSSFPCTTKRRITTNLKSINNQKCQKSKLHGTPTQKQTAQNHGFKETVRQNNQTGKEVDGETAVRQRTVGVGLAAARRQAALEGLTSGETETQS